jgi:hypothetical protein
MQIIKTQTGKIQLLKAGQICQSLLCTISYRVTGVNRIDLTDSANEQASIFADQVDSYQILPAAKVDFSGNAQELAQILDNELACTAGGGSGPDSPFIKNDIVGSGDFSGTPQTASVVFSTPFADNSYTVTVTGLDARVWTVENKTAAGFTINSNSNTALTGSVYWQAIKTGEN